MRDLHPTKVRKNASCSCFRYNFVFHFSPAVIGQSIYESINSFQIDAHLYIHIAQINQDFHLTKYSG